MVKTYKRNKKLPEKINRRNVFQRIQDSFPVIYLMATGKIFMSDQTHDLLTTMPKVTYN